ncbi:MAG: GntR family transcriptional regulator [Candidatus Brocadiia bacterium]|jgi:GntR family transcriptional regulator
MALSLTLNPSAKVAPFRQIMEQLRSAIFSGALAGGEQLPSVREMASRLAVNPLTIARALNELEAAGLIKSRWGKGNFVQPLDTALREDARRNALNNAAREFIATTARLGYDSNEAAKAIRDVGRGRIPNRIPAYSRDIIPPRIPGT